MLKTLMCLFCAANFLSAAQRVNSLQEMSDSFQNLTKKVSPAVVKVLVTGFGPVSDPEHGKAAVIRRQHSIGSGVIVDPSGYIITNAHVVTGAQQVTVVLRPADADSNPEAAVAHGRVLKAAIVGADHTSDIAVLKVDATGLPTLPIGDYREVHQGQLVLAFGSPEGLDDSVTMGVVSSVARQPDPDQPMIYIQTDAAVNPGNSGGPLVDVQGRLIGINTFILSDSGGSQGTNFAIPSVIVRFVYQEILTHGHVFRRVLGLFPQTLTSALAGGLGLHEEKGLLIADIAPDGPAAKAGIKIRDVVSQINGTPANTLPDYETALYRAPHGEPVTLDVLRGAEKLSFRVAVVEQEQHDVDEIAALVDPRNSLVQKLGVLGIEVSGKIAELIGEIRIESGVLVAAMADQPVESGLQQGDVIHAINDTPVRDLAGLRDALGRLKTGDPVALQIERDGRLMYVAFNLE